MLTWEDLCQDKSLQDLPYKIELTGRGQVLMSPTYFYHGNYAGRIISLLARQMGHGEVSAECAVQTSDGVREADVTWVSLDRYELIKDDFASHIAPELCVEILSPSNSIEEMMEKRRLFIAAGAEEYWLCNKEGKIRFFDADQELPNSRLCPDFPRDISQKK